MHFEMGFKQKETMRKMRQTCKTGGNRKHEDAPENRACYSNFSYRFWNQFS
jgi:hypothetical protein